MQRKNIDLMAPVGSYESLMAAIQAGANSVYFGIGNLNMRSRSSINFTFEDLRKIVNICNEAGVNTYLTVNTVIYDGELDTMRQIIDAAAEVKVSAVIVSDVAVMKYAREKGVEVHASTQLNIANIEAVEFYSQFCDVMVTARELSLDQVADITYQIKQRNIKGPNGKLVEIEVFCHGALCMAISGKCYMSLHEFHHSANRGACLQNCRRTYILKDKESDTEIEVDNEYLMSPKDLCTISFIDKIIDAGVSVLKIEGRARSAEYVKTVVECYDQAIKSVLDNTYNQEKIDEWTKRLSTVFNRGFWNGYYLGQRLGEWAKQHGSKATKTKVFLGKILNYYSNIGVAEIKLETDEELLVSDEIVILGPTTGVVQQFVEEIHFEQKSVKKVKQGDLFSIKTDELVRRGDKLYKLEDTEELKKRNRERKYQINNDA
ncbi:MAG: U32 family peptidase [Bacteroidales bacterium]|nr:U32 family peptidase [Bacteroidales bacterium]